MKSGKFNYEEGNLVEIRKNEEKEQRKEKKLKKKENLKLYELETKEIFDKLDAKKNPKTLNTNNTQNQRKEENKVIKPYLKFSRSEMRKIEEDINWNHIQLKLRRQLEEESQEPPVKRIKEVPIKKKTFIKKSGTWKGFSQENISQNNPRNQVSTKANAVEIKNAVIKPPVSQLSLIFHQL